MRAFLPIVLLSACAPTSETGLSDSADTSPGQICGPSAERGLEVGQCALDFTLPDSANQPFTLSAQRGKVALVDISALW